MKALRSFTAAVALAALSVVPAAAQAHASNQGRDVQSVSRPADQTPAQRTLARTLAREHDAYPAPSNPETQAVQHALAQERYYSTWRIGDEATGSAQPARPSRQPGGRIFLFTAVGLATLLVLATAATWRRLRARTRPREAT